MANQSRTVAQLTAAVIQLGFPDPDSGTSIGTYINNEYKTVAGERRWEWLQGTFTFNLTPGTFSYVLGSVSPGNVRNMDALWLTDSGKNQFSIQYADPFNLLSWNQDTPTLTVGAPRYWTVYGGNILFYPNPDQAYIVTVAYVKTLGDLPLAIPNTTDRPLMPGDYDMILVWGAGVMMATRLRDWLGRDFMSQQRDRVLGNMRADYQLKQRQNSDEVVETGIWGPSWKVFQNEPGWW